MSHRCSECGSDNCVCPNPNIKPMFTGPKLIARPATKWYAFDPAKGYHQKRPPERKVVLVKVQVKKMHSDDHEFLFMVGYLRYAAGDKSSPQFITPLPRTVADATKFNWNVVAWCDCIPDDVFVGPWDKLGAVDTPKVKLGVVPNVE